MRCACVCLSNTFFPVYSMPSRSSSPTVLDRSTSPLPRTARRCATGFAVRSPPSFASTCVPCERGVSFVSRSCVVAFVVSLPFCPRTPRAFRVVVRLVLDASSRTLSLSRLVSVESRGRILPAIAFAKRSTLPRVFSAALETRLWRWSDRSRTRGAKLVATYPSSLSPTTTTTTTTTMSSTPLKRPFPGTRHHRRTTFVYAPPPKRETTFSSSPYRIFFFVFFFFFFFFFFPFDDDDQYKEYTPRSALSFSLSFLVLFMARFERCHSHLGPSKSSPQFASHNT